MDGVVRFFRRSRALVLVGVLISCASAVLASDNWANDALLKKAIQERKDILQDVVGDGCRVTRVYFNGIAKRGIAKGRAFWSVACADGRTFMVMIPPNVNGTRVIACSKLKLLKLNSCFTKLRD